MSRGAQTFRQGDVTKAIKAAVAAGLSVARVEIEGAKIIVIAAKAGQGQNPETEVNEWDSVA